MLLLGPAIALLAACAGGESDAAGRSPRLVRLESRDFTFAGPVEIPAGLTRLRLVNRGPAWHDALITRLPDGATAETYLAGARAGQSFPAGAVDVGGPGLVQAGDSSEVVLDLAPGRYAIVCWHDNHVKSGMIVPFTVTGTEAAGKSERAAAQAAAPPGSSTPVVLHEYRFEHPPFVRGRHVLHVRNQGVRPHDMTIFRLRPGKTVRDYGAWYRSRQGPPPATPAGGANTMAPGREAWVPVTFEPGRYFIACATPEGEVMHAQLGMVEEFRDPVAGRAGTRPRPPFHGLSSERTMTAAPVPARVSIFPAPPAPAASPVPAGAA